MAATVIPKRLVTAPGAGVLGVLDHALRVAVGPTISHDATPAETTVQDLFRIHAGMRIVDIVLRNEVAFTTGGLTLMQVGDSDDADKYCDSAAWVLTAGVVHGNGVGIGYEVQDSDPTLIQAKYTNTTGLVAGSCVPLLIYSEKAYE